jgi:lipoprotein NlpD
MGNTSFQRLVTGLVLSTLLVGCSSTKSATCGWSTATMPRPAPGGDDRAVCRPPGDTLFSIAFRYGWDYKALAARNNIPTPYTIHPGQTIRFDGRTGSTSTRWSATAVPRRLRRAKPRSSGVGRTATTLTGRRRLRLHRPSPANRPARARPDRLGMAI